jgi:hypothetical protein
MLVEPTDSKATGQAILDIIINKDKWQRYSTNGIKNILAYSWPSHCIQYMRSVENLRNSDSGLVRTATRSQHRARHSFDNFEAAVADVEATLSELKPLDFRQRVRSVAHYKLPCSALVFAYLLLSICGTRSVFGVVVRLSGRGSREVVHSLAEIVRGRLVLDRITSCCAAF